MMVPQLANIATVDSLQSKAYWAPLSMGPQVFQTMHCISIILHRMPQVPEIDVTPDDTPSHRKAPGYTSVWYRHVAQANLLYFPHFQSPGIEQLYSKYYVLQQNFMKNLF